MLIGPALGGFIALLNLGVVFTIAAALSAITVIALVTLPNVRAQATVEVPARAMQIARRLLPLLLLGAGTSYMIGAFDTIWSLYLTYRGATTFLVGLSFVAFALPATLLSGYAGSLGDRDVMRQGSGAAQARRGWRAGTRHHGRRRGREAWEART